MTNTTHLERRLDRWMAHAVNPRKAAIVIASATITVTVTAGVLMTVVDRKGFPSIGSGLWWAIQTVTTVGYGDHVPETASGQIVAAVVMLLGIGFLTVTTASITSAFVGRTHTKAPAADDQTSSAEQIREMSGRLERIEASLERIEANQHS